MPQPAVRYSSLPIQLAARVLTSTMSSGFKLVANALKLCRHFSGRDDGTVGQFAEVELDTGTKEPVERHLVDSHHSFAVDRCRLEMDRRIHMGAIMRRYRHNF